MDDELNPRERAELERLRKIYGYTLPVARMLACVAAHAKQLQHVDGLPQGLHTLPGKVRRGEGLGHDSSALIEMSENLLHALNFKRNYDAPHFVYQDKVKNMPKNWTEELDSDLQDAVLDQTGGLESPDAEELQDLARAYWGKSLMAAALRSAERRENDQVARARREQQELADLLALEEEKAHPTAGTW